MLMRNLGPKFAFQRDIFTFAIVGYLIVLVSVLVYYAYDWLGRWLNW